MTETCDDQDIIRRDKREYPVNGFLDDGPFTYNIQQMLGHPLSALGPETRTLAAGHDDCIHICSVPPFSRGVTNVSKEMVIIKRNLVHHRVKALAF
jgi:hypothetical protein